MNKFLKIILLSITVLLFSACNKEKYQLEEAVTFNLNKKYVVKIDEAGIATITQEDKDFVVELSIGYFSEGENMSKRRMQYNKYYPLGLKKYDFAGKEGLLINTNKVLLLETEIDRNQYLQVTIKAVKEKDLISILETKEVETIIKAIKIK